MIPSIDVEVTTSPLDLNRLHDRLQEDDTSIGAISSFVGRVRGGEGLTALELEAYEPVTRLSLEQIARTAQERWPLDLAMIHHRSGLMPLGEPIVFVGARSAHRVAVLESVAYMIDVLKTEAPFWKREHFDATTRWVEARTSDENRARHWQETTE